MREIKFRMWDPNSRTLKGGAMFYLNNTATFKYCETDKKLIPLQYTGLKDPNGKEIYEGDILEYTYITNVDLFKGFQPVTQYGVVHWCEGDAGFKILNNDNKHMWALDRDVTIVGNIYENPLENL